MAVGGLTPLEGGSCELSSVHVRRSGRADYYSALLKFSNGQNVSVPIYVPFAEGDASFEKRAFDVAIEIGKIAARTGEVNPVEWILEGKVPLRDFLQQSMRTACNAEKFPAGLQFSTHLSPIEFAAKSAESGSGKAYAALHVLLFNGNEHQHQSDYSLSVPPEFVRPDLLAFLDSVIDEALGSVRRNKLKSSSHFRASVPPETIIVSLPHSYLQCPVSQNALAKFRLDPRGDVFACSLGVKDSVVARERLDRAIEFIRHSLETKKTLTVADVKECCRGLSQESSPLPARVNSSRVGPVIIYLPTREEESKYCKEALRIYTALSGDTVSGFELRVNTVGPNGRGTDKMYGAVCTIPATLGLTMQQAEALRAAVRQFLEIQLSRFYQAGGRFRDKDDIGFGSRGKPALTREGADKFHRILEGRLTSDFIQAALDAGITNPFDIELPAATIRKLGGFQLMPQPAHPSLRLLNPHAISAQDGAERIRSTIVWNGRDHRELFKRTLEFSGIEQIVAFVQALDQWTAKFHDSNDSLLPVHTGVAILRQLCRPFQDPRQTEMD